jgi:hypothetical protein
MPKVSPDRLVLGAALGLGLASIAGVAFAADGTPAKEDAVANDPYQWLEDVTATSRSPGSASRTRRAKPSSRASRNSASSSRHPRHPRFDREDPGRREDRRLLLQLLEGQGPRARPVAPHDARRIPQAESRQWETVLDLDALNAAEKAKLGLARRRLPQAGLHALPGRAVARRLGCRRHARIRPVDEAVREDGFFRPEAKGGWAGSTRHACTSTPTSAPATA